MAKTAEQQIKAAEKKANAAIAQANNTIAESNKKVSEANDKLVAQGKQFDAARRQINELESQNKAMATELEEARARVAFEHGEGFEVKLVRDAPFKGRILPVGSVIGTITPVEGESPDYVVDAVRSGYAKCVACEKSVKATEGNEKEDEGGGDES